jgi:Cyclic nucleotide-binding domain.
LSEQERDQIARSMVTRQYAAGEVVLAHDEVPDSLMVIGTGVVSVTLPDPKGPVEAGRMGRGDHG